MRLIDADAIKLPKGFFEEVDNVPKFYEWLNELPTIEPKRGKWIKDEGAGNSLYKCSACNDLCTVAGWANCIPEKQMYKAFKYCPNCGAAMERSEN